MQPESAERSAAAACRDQIYDLSGGGGLRLNLRGRHSRETVFIRVTANPLKSIYAVKRNLTAISQIENHDRLADAQHRVL